MKYNSITSITGEEQDPPIFKEPTMIEFRRLKRAFAEWLRLLNFEPTTVKHGPTKLQEFLYWLESQGITEIQSITRPTITKYFDYLIQRQNQTKGRHV